VANRYLALLRGINVGGRNRVPMADLRACFEGAGLVNVTTYIQSGNVVFESVEPGRTGLTDRLEHALAKEFGFAITVVLRSHQQLQNTVARAPRGFGEDPAKYRYDVIFLKPTLTPAAAMKVVSLREGVDEAAAGPGALYFWRLASKAAQSRMSRIVGTPEYQSMTIRNWNTTTKLLALLDAMKARP
jgi:uncharacterized protein (DUF1697 family)